jgi:catecholate siderophore receptor
MQSITKTRRLKALGASSVALAAAMMASGAAAQDTQLGTVKVQSQAIDPNPNATPGVPYKAQTSGDERRTRPIAETPATIQIITGEVIKDSGKTDLKSILLQQPGITTGTGENGNQFGDRYIIRGREAQSDTFVDGLRDPGMSIRESFAIEQLEITKGPNSSFAGRGSAGGAINAITKRATTDYNFIKGDGSFGTDNFWRTTADINQAFTDNFAVRANLLYSYSRVPERAPSDRYRLGGAVSATWLINPDAELTLDYYGLHAKDGPDTGSYLTGNPPNRLPKNPLPPSVTQSQDFLRSDQNVGTARFSYRFDPQIRFSNILRLGRTKNGYVLSSAERDATTTARNPGGSYVTSVVGTHQSWQNVDYFADQASLFADVDIGGLKNEFVASYEYSDNHVLNGNYNNTNTGAFNCITGTGTGTALNAYCPTGANNVPVANLGTLLGRNITRGNPKGEWQVKTHGISLMDTVSITNNLTVFAGIRADFFDYSLDVINSTTLTRTPYRYKGDLVNYHAGLVYQITPEINVYASFGTAQDINGGESDVGNNSSYGGLQLDPRCGCAPPSKPETSQNFELGTKWNLFEGRFLATAALFQTTKYDVNEALSAGETEAFGTVNTGQNSVSGVELEVVGMPLDDLTVQGGLTYASAEVDKSILATNVGHTLANFANFSTSLQAKYRVWDELSLGVIGQYISRRYGGQPDTAAVFAAGNYSQPVPAYAVMDLFATYKVNANLGVRLNVGNVFNRDYYTSVYRGGFFLYKGDARNVRLTLDYDL